MSARNLWIVTLLAVPALSFGQQSQITGPVAGYVFDGSARGLRPVLGIPGAALLGEPLDFGLQVATVAVAPRQDAALVTAAAGTLHLFRIQSGVPADLNFNGLARAPERIVFSPSGTAAAVYAGGLIQIVSGLPNSPAIAASLNLQSAPDSLALSDDGAMLLVAAGSNIERFAGAADQGSLASTAGPALVAFAPAGYDAAIVDRAGAGVVLFRNLGGNAGPQILAASDNTIQASSALAFSTDGQQLLLTSSAGQSVTTFDLASGGRGAIPCSCAPSTLARMGDVFRLNELSRDPLWLLDARPASAGVTFVPPAASDEANRRPGQPKVPGRRFQPLGDSTSPSSKTQAQPE